MSQIEQNLETAFAGESQANRKYLFFAEQADKEGLAPIARLFRAAAAAETVHARNHLRVLAGIKSTKENLAEAASGESYEFTTMYPGFIEQSKADNNQRAEISFTHANAVEQIHHGLYRQALSALESGQELGDAPYFVCQICGNTVAGQAPERCPVCGAPRGQFKQVD